jgi:hypothetical protein
MLRRQFLIIIFLLPVFFIAVRALGSDSSLPAEKEKSTLLPIPLFSLFSEHPQGFASVVEKDKDTIYTLFSPLPSLEKSFVYRAWLISEDEKNIFPLGDLTSSPDGFFLDVTLRRAPQIYKKIIITKDPLNHPDQSSKNLLLEGTL